MDNYRCPVSNSFHLGHGRTLRSSRLAFESESVRKKNEYLRCLNMRAGLLEGGARYDPKTEQRILTSEEVEQYERGRAAGLESMNYEQRPWWIEHTGHEPPRHRLKSNKRLGPPSSYRVEPKDN
jgi:hypothetical protein